MSLLHSIGYTLIPAVLKALVATLRVTVTNPEQQPERRSGKMIVAFWHGKMICGWLFARSLFARQTMYAVVSLSEDGELLSRVLAKLEFHLIRGSSSRGGGAVKETMLRALNNNGIIAITPDGPRGPRHSFKYGTLRLAAAHRIPILFATIKYSNALTLKSWDKFEIPLPFSAVDVTLHRIDVPPLPRDENIAAFERQLAKQLSDEDDS